MQNNLEIIRKIKELEKQLNNLKLKLIKSKSKATPIEKGDTVIILNPRAGQGKRGIVTKVNWYTNRVTIEATGTAGQKQKVVRALGNV